MPASVSSPIVVLAAHAGLDGRGGVEPDADLLAAVPDPRKARGCRHWLVSVLAIGVCAVLAGARSYVAIAEMGAGSAGLGPATAGPGAASSE